MKPDNAFPSRSVPAALCRRRGWTSEAIERLELGWDGERVVIPVRDATGELLGCARYLPEGLPKMKADAGTSRELFPPPETIAETEGGGWLWLVEGEPDCVRAWSLGLPAVAVPGAQNWRPEWAPRFTGRRVLVCFDTDESGRRAAARAAGDLAACGIDARVLDLDPSRDDGFDLSDFTAKARSASEREEARRILARCAEIAPLAELPHASWNGQGAPHSGEDDHASDPAEPFPGLSHAEALRVPFEGARELVEDTVEAGVIGAIVGVPETHKSFVAQAIAVGVARGEGEILGRPVVSQGPAGYFWQDDSRRNELERVRAYERVHASPPDLPLTWFLNEGLQLPRDLGRLRATVERLGLVLVVLDSFYNLAEVDLKERAAGQIVAALKAEVCDPTGCTVLIVDHMPWATEVNRGRLRAYGDVFKGAATRFGIYIDAERGKLWVEARGNNIRGFRRTPAYWDAEALALRLVDTAAREEDEAELEELVLTWLREHPGEHSTTAVRNAIPKRAEAVDRALERLKGRDEVRDLGRNSGMWSGRPGAPRYWITSNHAESTSSPLFGTTSDDQAPGVPKSMTSSAPSHPRRGDEVVRDEVNSDAPQASRASFSSELSALSQTEEAAPR